MRFTVSLGFCALGESHIFSWRPCAIALALLSTRRPTLACELFGSSLEFPEVILIKHTSIVFDRRICLYKQLQHSVLQQSHARIPFYTPASRYRNFPYSGCGFVGCLNIVTYMTYIDKIIIIENTNMEMMQFKKYMVHD